MAPSWRNTGPRPSRSPASVGLHRPRGRHLRNPDAAAQLRHHPRGNDAAACTDCYTVSITAAARPAPHWDATILETVTPDGATKTLDAARGRQLRRRAAGAARFFRFVETLLHRGVTGGCGGDAYCPAASTTREQMAVFVLLSKEGARLHPARLRAARGLRGRARDQPVLPLDRGAGAAGRGRRLRRRQLLPGERRSRASRWRSSCCARWTRRSTRRPARRPNIFADVPESSPFCRWIEELARRGVVTGCGGGNYCPAEPVTREQMAVFLA